MITFAEQKWRASEAKVRFAQSFPPLLHQPDNAKPILKTVKMNTATLVVYSDYTFTFDPLDIHDAPKFLSTLRESEIYLEGRHQPDFNRLAELTRIDKNFTRLAKMEKLLGAVVNNALERPELLMAIPKLLANPAFESESYLPENPNIKAIRLLNAIKMNLPEIPELHDEIPKVLNGTSSLVQCDSLKALRAL